MFSAVMTRDSVSQVRSKRKSHDCAVVVLTLVILSSHLLGWIKRILVSFLWGGECRVFFCLFCFVCFFFFFFFGGVVVFVKAYSWVGLCGRMGRDDLFEISEKKTRRNAWLEILLTHQIISVSASFILRVSKIF